MMTAGGVRRIGDIGRAGACSRLQHVCLAGSLAVAHRSLQEPVWRQAGRTGAERGSREPETDLTCPPVSIRAGASTYAVAAPGKQPVGNDVRFQATITRTARRVYARTATRSSRELAFRAASSPGRPARLPRSTYPCASRSCRAASRKRRSPPRPTRPRSRCRKTAASRSLWWPKIWSIRCRRERPADSYIFYIGFDPQALKSSKREAATNSEGGTRKSQRIAGTRVESADGLFACCRSVQLFANFRDALGQQIVGDVALHRLRQDAWKRRSPRHRRRRRGRRPRPGLRPARSCSRRSWCAGRQNLPS